MHLRPGFDDGLFTELSIAAVFPLLDKNNEPLPRDRRDAEGLSGRRTRNTILNDSELVVSFEGVPRIERFTPQGVWLGSIEVPQPFHDSARYQNRNRALEAVTETARHGLLAAPERPLRQATSVHIPVFSIAGGGNWLYPSLARKHGALVGLETTPRDELIILERQFISFLHPIKIRITRSTPGSSGLLKLDELAVFDNHLGWAVDNFEGIARYRDETYFIVSDDNGSMMQNTLIVAFEIVNTR